MDAAAYGWGLPPLISTHGGGIDQLIHVLHVFMVLLFLGWTAFMSYCLYRFRERPGHQACYQVDHFKAPTYLEAGVALFEVFLLFGLSVPIVVTLKQRFPRPQPDKTLEVRVVAQQFAWNIHYPGADGKFGRTDPKLIDDATNPLGRDPKDPAGRDDASTVNQLFVPVDTKVTLHISSKDVIHGFSVPVLRVKQDAIPGEVVPLWFEANRTGEFQIACAQLCGDSHYKMIGSFRVQSREEFKKWLAERVEESALEEDEAAPRKPTKKDEFE
jgi:cytochrome c oxidase subunit 2